MQQANNAKEVPSIYIESIIQFLWPDYFSQPCFTCSKCSAISRPSHCHQYHQRHQYHHHHHHHQHHCHRHHTIPHQTRVHHLTGTESMANFTKFHHQNHHRCHQFTIAAIANLDHPCQSPDNLQPKNLPLLLVPMSPISDFFRSARTSRSTLDFRIRGHGQGGHGP